MCLLTAVYVEIATQLRFVAVLLRSPAAAFGGQHSLFCGSIFHGGGTLWLPACAFPHADRRLRHLGAVLCVFGLLISSACSKEQVNRISEADDSAGISDPAERLVRHILAERGAPLRDLPGLKVFHVRDFGAVPNDGINDYDAIQAAIQAMGKGSAELQFEPGTYNADPGGGAYSEKDPPVMIFQSLENAVIDGQGALILIERPNIGFSRTYNCRNLIVRNFSVDYDPLPFSQGTIIAANPLEKWIDVKADAGFPDLDDSLFTSYGSWGMLKDPAFPGKLKDGAPNVLFRSSCKKIGENVFRIVLNKPFDDFLKVGDRYAQISRAAGGCEYHGNENITFDHITFYAVPGSLFVGSETSRLNVLNCRGKLKENRLLLSGADGVHCQAARVGPWVEGCEFEGLSDDCLNIYSLPFYITKILVPNRFQMTRTERLLPGDPLVFFRPQTGEVLAETEVLSVDGNIVTLKDHVTGLHLAPEGTPYDHHSWKIYDHAYNPNATGNYFVYRNNYLHDGRRFGGFIKASYGLIENNRFERLSDSALQIQNEPDWPEGFWAQNLVIRNNRVLNCAFVNHRIPVNIEWGSLGNRPSEFSYQQNIFFENNTVRTVSGPCARFDGIDGLMLSGNVFESGSGENQPLIGETVTLGKKPGE